MVIMKSFVSFLLLYLFNSGLSGQDCKIEYNNFWEVNDSVDYSDLNGKRIHFFEKARKTLFFIKKDSVFDFYIEFGDNVISYFEGGKLLYELPITSVNINPEDAVFIVYFGNEYKGQMPY